MAETKSKMSLDQKLVEVQKAVRGLSKDAENKGMHYPYVSGSKLLSYIRPKMDELELLLVQEYVPESVQIIGNTFLCTVKFTWVDTESAEDRVILFPAAGQNAALDKAIGCMLTYSERYMLMKMFHIPTDEDDADARDDVPQPVQSVAVPQKPKNRPTNERIHDCAIWAVKNGNSEDSAKKTLESSYLMTAEDVQILHNYMVEIKGIKA